MIVLFSSHDDDPVRWENGLRGHFPDLDFRVWPDAGGRPEDVDFALVWGPKPGALRRYPNLKAIFSLGAGVDHLLKDPDLPEGVPIVRLVDPGLTRGMVEFVLHRVLHFHREFPLYDAYQRAVHWQTRRMPDSAQRRIGILGLGHLGRACAQPLVGLGFPVAGWSRTARAMDGVESFHGADGLGAFLGRTDILVCLLPLTPATAGIIDAGLLGQLPEGAFVVNAARGGHVVDDDLLAALDSGHIAGAALDVFHSEPLDTSHPFWTHPSVLVTPHMASLTNTQTAAATVAANMRRILAGEPPRDVVERERGY